MRLNHFKLSSRLKKGTGTGDYVSDHNEKRVGKIINMHRIWIMRNALENWLYYASDLISEKRVGKIVDMNRI